MKIIIIYLYIKFLLLFPKEIKKLNWLKFKKIMFYSSLLKNHKLYEALCTSYDFEIKFAGANYKKHFFDADIGGAGTFSLNTFRILFNEKKYFEKIYKSNSTHLINLEIFNNNFSDFFISNNVNVPIIKNRSKGRKLAVIHFNYLELTSHSNKKELTNFIYNFIGLCSKIDLWDCKKNNLQVYYENIIFKGVLSKILNYSNQTHKRIQKINYNISKEKLFFCHFDIKESNFFKNTVIDWDSFGLAPLEYSYSQSLFNITLKKFSLTKDFDFVKNNIKTDVPFKINYKKVLFFYMFFDIYFNSKMYDKEKTIRVLNLIDL
jgi:hypothetical protein